MKLGTLFHRHPKLRPQNSSIPHNRPKTGLENCWLKISERIFEQKAAQPIFCPLLISLVMSFSMTLSLEAFLPFHPCISIISPAVRAVFRAAAA